MCVFWGIKSADRLWLWFLVGAVESSDLSWLIDRFFNFDSQFITNKLLAKSNLSLVKSNLSSLVKSNLSSLVKSIVKSN